MKTMLKRAVAMALTLLLLLGTVSLDAYAETSLSSDYGYQSLNSSEKAVYDIIESGIANKESSISIPIAIALSKEETFEVVEMVIADHPEYFWFIGNFYFAQFFGLIHTIEPTYEIYGGTVSADVLELADTLFQNAVTKIMDEMKTQAGSDDYSKAVWLHDKLAQTVTYQENSNDQTAYGALVDGICVCAGYARAYQYLLHRAGIKSWTVLGTSSNPATGGVENHAWNLLWLDGNCVYADVTWDDQGTELFHLFFGRNLAEMNRDHAVDATYYADKLPNCNCTNLGYFDVYSPENDVTNHITAEYIAQLLKPVGDGKTWQAVLYATTESGLEAWLSNVDNLIAVLKNRFEMGDFSISMNCLDGKAGDMELHLTVVNNAVTTGVTLTGTVTSYLDADAPVSIDLLQDGEVVYSTISLDAFILTNVAAGTYTMRLTKQNHATFETTLTVAESDQTLDFELCPVGDVTGDGKVNMKDWSVLYDQINEISILNGYALSCADVNGDGKVNMKDWSRLYDHISEENPLW